MHVFVSGALVGRKKVLKLLELELQIFVSHSVDIGT